MNTLRFLARCCAVMCLGFAVGTAWATNTECSTMGKMIVSTNLRFSLSHSQVPGQLAISQHRLKVAGSHYTLESVSEAKGLMALMFSGQLIQKSEGLIDAKVGFVPLYYAEKRGKRPLTETLVSTESQEVIFKKNESKAPLERGLQDRMSMIYQISALLRCSNTLKKGDTLALKVMGTGRVAQETFSVLSGEALTINMGKGEQTMPVLEFESKPEHADDEIVRVWFAKSLNWLPVKIQLSDKEGKSMTQTLIGVD